MTDPIPPPGDVHRASPRWDERTPSPPTVFISHASADAVLAADVVRTLEAAGLRCWIAPHHIPAGADWAETIAAGIRQSQVLIVLLSAHSATSPEVHREVALAGRARKQMLGVRVDRHAALAGPLEYYLSSIQWVDATARPFRAGLARLPESVSALLGTEFPRGDGGRVPPQARDGRASRSARNDVGPDLDKLLGWGPRPP